MDQTIEHLPVHQEKTKSPISKPEEIILKTGIPETKTDLGCSSNDVILVDIKDDGKGIFKPKYGEQKDLRDGVKAGTYFLRERATYLVDLFLGLDLVPPTTIREIDNQAGSIQQFVEDASVSFLYEGAIKKEWRIKLAVLDYVVWNSDRHEGNFLIKNDGTRIFAIDNGLTFGPDSYAYTGGLYNNTVSDLTIQKLKAFTTSNNVSVLSTLLEELIGTEETEACVARIQKITELAQMGEITPQKFAELEYHPKSNKHIVQENTVPNH